MRQAFLHLRRALSAFFLLPFVLPIRPEHDVRLLQKHALPAGLARLHQHLLLDPARLRLPHALHALPPLRPRGRVVRARPGVVVRPERLALALLHDRLELAELRVVFRRLAALGGVAVRAAGFAAGCGGCGRGGRGAAWRGVFAPRSRERVVAERFRKFDGELSGVQKGVVEGVAGGLGVAVGLEADEAELARAAVFGVEDFGVGDGGEGGEVCAKGGAVDVFG
mmetsp:Transcript_5745/g.13908  ORF Transcript_5745/g.13908 Transcript_5745/m.13908 type:complete len:224 (-) Transcript_5745:57-728(-)